MDPVPQLYSWLVCGKTRLHPAVVASLLTKETLRPLFFLDVLVTDLHKAGAVITSEPPPFHGLVTFQLANNFAHAARPPPSAYATVCFCPGATEVSHLSILYAGPEQNPLLPCLVGHGGGVFRKEGAPLKARQHEPATRASHRTLEDDCTGAQGWCNARIFGVQAPLNCLIAWSCIRRWPCQKPSPWSSSKLKSSRPGIPVSEN